MMMLRRLDIDKADELEAVPGRVEGDIFSRLLEEARDTGPFTTEIMKHIWLNHLHKAESEINLLFRFGYRFSLDRLEAACKRVIFYGLTSPDLVKTVLFSRLDSLELNHTTDIYGQYKLF
jgi:hypothetical protein